MRRQDQRRAAVVALYQHEVTGRSLDEVLPRSSSRFTRELAEGAAADRDSLDALVERHAVDWSLDRIAPLELSILRVAIFELLRREDVPDEVAIDQAVEAAKELCGSEAPGFVNGILGAVKREHVPTTG
jgi:transcription antitermination protein NusB